MRRINLLASLGVVAGLATIAPALAADPTTIVSATLGNSVSITAAPSSTVDFGTLPALGTTLKSAGSIAVSANVPYTLTVIADQPAMTKYASGAYDTAVRLASSLGVVPTLSGLGTGVAAPALAVGNASPSPIATGVGTGVVAPSDTYSLQLSQATVPTDAPATYRTVLTYTASATL